MIRPLWVLAAALLLGAAGCTPAHSTLPLSERHGLVYTYESARIDTGSIEDASGVIIPDVPFEYIGRVLVVESDSSYAILYKTPSTKNECLEVWTRGRASTPCFEFGVSTAHGMSGLSADQGRVYLARTERRGTDLLVRLAGNGVGIEEAGFPASTCSVADGWDSPVCFDFLPDGRVAISDCDIDTRQCKVVQTIENTGIGNAIKMGRDTYVLESNDGEFCISSASSVGLSRLYCSTAPTVLLGALGTLDRGEVFVEVIDDDGFSTVRQISLRDRVVDQDQVVAERAMLARLVDGPALVYNHMSMDGGALLASYHRVPIDFPDAPTAEVE